MILKVAGGNEVTQGFSEFIGNASHHIYTKTAISLHDQERCLRLFFPSENVLDTISSILMMLATLLNAISTSSRDMSESYASASCSTRSTLSLS